MLLLLKGESLSMLYLFAAIFGFGYGCLAPLTPILLADRFGRHALGAAYGLVTFFIGVGGSLGPFLAGYIHDRCGSYDGVWLSNVFLLLAVTVAVLRLQPKENH